MRPALVALVLIAVPFAVEADGQYQAAIEGCIDALRATGLPDAQSGEVLRTEFSQAAIGVTLRDRGNSEWLCLSDEKGHVSEIRMTNAMDDGEGALAGLTETRQVQFAPGSVGAEYEGGLVPGGSMRYVLGAREGQFLDVAVTRPDPGISYQILNPDGSFLLDMMDPSTPYRGQLWQSGDHVVEVVNRGQSSAGYAISFRIE